MKLPATYRYTGFYDLLADAIFQHRLAASCTDSYLMNRHARSSVIASALSIECAANCLLGSVELPKALFDALDKLNSLSKTDFIEPVGQRARSLSALSFDFLYALEFKGLV